MQKKIALIIHGGCGSYEETDRIEMEHQEEQKKGLQEIIKKGWNYLNSGKSAVDTVEHVVNLLEENPAFNAGIGSAIGSSGKIEMDASIMDGSSLSCGAVTGLINMRHPISVAREIMSNSKHVFLAGKGANDFAKKIGFVTEPSKTFYTAYQKYWWNKLKPSTVPNTQSKGTVGAVALDIHGNIAAGTSTGGLTRKMPGRVGDTPIIGAGTYANDRIGGASATGYGEQIIKVVLTKTAIDILLYKKASAQHASEEAIKQLEKLPEGKGGIILIDKNGSFGAFSNETYLPRAYMNTDMEKPSVAFSV